MQTFLPYADFEKSAQVLDYRRLGKQRVEAWQILQTLIGESFSWKNHPAVKMWEGYEYKLAEYGVIICTVWVSKNYSDSLLPRFCKYLREYKDVSTDKPFWLGDESFHQSHRLKLLWKFPDHYKKFFQEDVPETEPKYVWPV